MQIPSLRSLRLCIQTSRRACRREAKNDDGDHERRRLSANVLCVGGAQNGRSSRRVAIVWRHAASTIGARTLLSKEWAAAAASQRTGPAAPGFNLKFRARQTSKSARPPARPPAPQHALCARLGPATHKGAHCESTFHILLAAAAASREPLPPPVNLSLSDQRKQATN